MARPGPRASRRAGRRPAALVPPGEAVQQDVQGEPELELLVAATALGNAPAGGGA
jgi:hypothetical protein